MESLDRFYNTTGIASYSNNCAVRDALTLSSKAVKYAQIVWKYLRNLINSLYSTVDVLLDCIAFVINPKLKSTLGKNYVSYFSLATTLKVSGLGPGVISGISNDSNLCYLISSIQPFFNHPYFEDYLKQAEFILEHSKDAISKVLEDNYNLRMSILKLLKEWYYKYSILNAFEQMEYASQLRCLAGKFCSDLIKDMTGWQDAGIIIEVILQSLGYSLKVNKTLTAEYSLGNYISEKEGTPLSYLSIPLGINESNLQNLINEEFSPEIHKNDIENAYHLQEDNLDELCPNWSSENKIVSKPPNMLVVQLKRYKNNLYRDSRSVMFPEDDIFELSKVFDTPVNYRVVGLVIHSEGHYISHIKRDHWYCCNDNYVYKIENHEVLRSNAYYVFLERVQTGFSAHSS